MTKKLTCKIAIAVMLVATLPAVAQGLDAKQERTLKTVVVLSNTAVAPTNVGSNVVTVNGGSYGGRAVGSVGVSHRWDKRVSTHATVAFDQGRQPAWKVGVTYHWK